MRAPTTGRLPGRFLPGDPRVEEPYRLTPQVALRVAILGFLALGVFAVLFLRLWALQVLAGSRYLVDANNNRVRTLHLDAPRGAIVDTNGHVLVKNVLGIGLELWPADMPKGKAARRREIEAIAVVAAMPVKEILARMAVYENDPLTPVVLRRGIHDDQISYFKEHQLQFPGVHLAQSYLRKYPFESLAAQTLGHVGAITPDQVKAARKAGYRPQDVMGQAGIERSFDKYLRGTDGLAQLTVDSRGTPTSQIQSRALPVPGNTLRLTIDIGLQRAAERALRFGIQTARATGSTYANGGAIVALNPRTGAVLALASNPTYEPSVYVGRDPDKLAPLQNDAAAAAKNYPGINRALSSVYPPGSVWKPVTAFAAIGENLVTPTQEILCSSSFEFYGQTFTNWDPYVNRWMELPQALAESCDTYFYRLGVGFYDLPSTRGPTLQNWALRLGFGAKTGIEVGPEASGLVPTPAWRCKHFGGPPCKGYVDRIWKPGYEIQLTIGQGDLEVTPIQMARLYALIANGGNLVTPHIGQDIEAPAASGGRAQVLRELFTQQPFKSGIDPTAIQAVQQGLYAATHSTLGTSYGVFGQFPVAIAGKTGTAEKLVRIPGYPNPLKLNQSWWCGYGPYEEPTIALCTVIENGGHGGGAAALASLRVFEAYFKKHGIVTSHITD